MHAYRPKFWAETYTRDVTDVIDLFMPLQALLALEYIDGALSQEVVKV